MNQRTFITSNIQLAGWLLQSGHVPEVKRSPDNPNKAEFHFERSEALDSAVGAFLDGSARVNPATHRLALDQLHDEVRRVLRSGGGQ
jgi:hypothetical protein